MRRDTFERALRRLNQTAPFEPFTVELVTGVRLISRHPEAIVVRDDLATFGETDGNAQYFDASCVARLATVVIPHGAE